MTQKFDLRSADTGIITMLFWEKNLKTDKGNVLPLSAFLQRTSKNMANLAAGKISSENPYHPSLNVIMQDKILYASMN